MSTPLVIRQELDPSGLLDDRTQYYVNPTGSFILGGPFADAGLTGRKIIVDTYGGVGSHGGGAFSGKDPSKVDRSAAYITRYLAKNVVAAGLAERCEIQVAYAIGVARPLSVNVETFGTGRIDDDGIEELVREHFDLRPFGILKMLDLLNSDQIKYRKTAAYGHFGREHEGPMILKRALMKSVNAIAAQLVERVGPDVDEDEPGAPEVESVGGRHECVGGEDDLVSRLEVAHDRCHL
mgnify:CR=1 FL=1